MTITGSMEGDLPTEKKPEAEKTTVAKLLFGFSGLYERWRNELEARKFDPGAQHEPDFGERLRRVEGQLGRDYPDVRIDRYEEGGGKNSWKDYILGILALLIVAWLGRLSYQMDDLIRVVAKQDVDEKRIARLECTTYKICP